MAKNKVALSADEILAWRKARWLARFDLVYLCNEILGYKDVSEKVHGGLINVLQKFPKPNKEQFYENDVYKNGKWEYKPIYPMEDFVSLSGKRRRLILDSRGHLKTTINCQAHTLQWLLNYPLASVHIIQSNLDKAAMIVNEIRDHFRYNPKLRALFPELCPQKGIEDFGKVGEFNIRKFYDITNTTKEPSVLAGSIDKGSAGMHFTVMKFSDIVDPNNSFGDMLDKVAKSFYMAENLLVAPTYWIDVEGTRYNFGDVYGRLIETYTKAKKENREPEYAMYVRACFERDTGDKPPEYTPEEQSLPFKRDKEGKRIPVWPERFPLHKLEEQERTDAVTFNSQQLNYPIGGIDGQVLFEWNPEKNYPALISRENFKNNVRISHYEISVDFAETVTTRSDYTAMTVCAWTASGKPFIVEIVHGKFLPKDAVNRLFQLYAKYHNQIKPQVNEIRMEDVNFTRGLNAYIGAKEAELNIKLPIVFLKRDNNVAKTDRILKTLQPWYVNRDIRFLDDLPELEALKRELQQFPNSPHDDILDTLADLFNGKEYFGRLGISEQYQKNLQAKANDKLFQAQYGILNVFDPEYDAYTQAGNKISISKIPW